jgi:hypothetical protein
MRHHFPCRWDAHHPGVPSPPAPDPNLKALLARLADTLELARVTVDDLARDLASHRWQGLPPSRSRRSRWQTGCNPALVNFEEPRKQP